MRLTIVHEERRRDLQVSVLEPTATVDDLLSAVVEGSTDGSALWDGDRVLAPETPIHAAGVVEGAVLTIAGPTTGTVRIGDGTSRGPWELVVVGGPDAGRRFPLAVGRWTLGRRGADVDLDHPTVSARHAALTIAVDGTAAVVDLGSRHGTRLDEARVRRPTLIGDGVIRLGAVSVAVGRAADAARPLVEPVTGATTTPYHRPPRPSPPAPPALVALPEPPAADAARPPFGALAVVAPVLLGGGMAFALGDWRYALLALLGPVTAAAQAVDLRRRTRRRRRRDGRRLDRELATLAAQLAESVTVERRRRRATVVDPAEVLWRAEQRSSRLWERRPGQSDFGRLRLGTADQHWDPPVEIEPHDRRVLDARIAAALDAHRRLPGAPMAVELGGDEVLGIIGPRPQALAVGRSLVLQAAVHHGPADLAIRVEAGPERLDDWDWTKWLPHASRGVAGLVVLDERFDERRPSSARCAPQRADAMALVVLAERRQHLPARCRTVIELSGPGDGGGDDGLAVVHRIGEDEHFDRVVVDGLSEDRAESAARALARFVDPEVEPGGSTLPASCSLLSLLGLRRPSPQEIGRRWAAGRTTSMRTPIGVSAHGVFSIDLVADGPHALVAGTTGSGKSELLRSLVAGMASTTPPSMLTFLLIDFKGGAAFAECARLPHTVGLITDLDRHLAVRVLRSLGAEVRHREHRLRAADADDIDALADAAGEPLPRLMVVIDEFATLAAELPDFVAGLVDLARRGRSLGIHLVLATQRPSGAVSEQIRANTNLRIALRTQDAADSVDVVGTAEAASVDRSRPGRALVRLGPGPPVAVQTALATANDAAAPGRLLVRPFRLDDAGRSTEASRGGEDLRRLVEGCIAAHLASDRPAPRRPWLEPLPEQLDWATVAEPACGAAPPRIVFALADDPDRQRQEPFAWTPEDGNLVLVGAGGSGTTTALLTIAHAATRTDPLVHLYALDLDAGRLRELESLEHTGAVVTAAERERQLRLISYLGAELDRRHAVGARPHGRIVLLLDGLGAFRSAWEDGLDGLTSRLARLFSEGPAVGIHAVITAARPGDVPAAMTGVAGLRLALRLADPTDSAAFGVPPSAMAGLPPGRAVVAQTGQLVQIALPPGPTGRTVAVPRRIRPQPIGTLPKTVDPRALRSGFDREAWWLLVGIGDRALRPVGLALHPGDHALIAGAGRSGCTGALLTMAGLAAEAADRPTIVAVAGPRSPWTTATGPDLVVAPADAARALAWLADRDPVLALIDDADRVDDSSGELASLLDERRPDLRVVAAGRSDGLRRRYGHWTRIVRASRTGVLLQPDVDLDGDLLGVRLPRRAPVPLTRGRGYLVSRDGVELVQAALTLSDPP